MGNRSVMHWTVYRGAERMAKCMYPEDAAALVAMCGEGGTVKFGEWIVWREGREDFSAAESFDRAAALMLERSTAKQAAWFARATAAIVRH